MTQETQMILNFTRDIKIKLLKDSLDQENIGIFLSLSKILLDAPLNSGGLESEIIESIHNEYLYNR